MDAADALPQTGDSKVRVLLLFIESQEALELGRRLAAGRFEVVSCPLTVATPRWVDELQPDLVVLVPPEDESGLQESCQAARALTDAPLVVVTTRDEEATVTRALAAGVDEYFVLPMGDRELSARMDAMLRRMERNAALNATRRVGNMVLSATDHSVTRDGRKIFLSPIEFRLLACLATAPGKVLTHQTLMSRVWGVEYVDSRHYLRVYVRYLREKLEEDPNHPRLILSEWGVGYRLQVSNMPVAPEQRRENAPRQAPSYGLA